VSTHTGGGAVNAAVAMARLGMDVMILAKIGNDERGEMILQRLEQEGVSTSLVKRDPHAPTGTLVPKLIPRWGEGGPTLSVAPGEEVPSLAARRLSSGGYEMSVAGVLRALTQLGPMHVIITDGARGAFVGSRDEIIFGSAQKSKVFGTAGAGDAFAATFAAYLAQGHRIDEALIAASINSASVVQYVDTQTGLLRRQHLDEKVASGYQAI
jgi:ribokinase